MWHMIRLAPTKVEDVPAEYGGLSPETANLFRSMPDTPDSRALKQDFLAARNQLHRSFRAALIRPDASWFQDDCCCLFMIKATQVEVLVGHLCQRLLRRFCRRRLRHRRNPFLHASPRKPSLHSSPCKLSLQPSPCKRSLQLSPCKRSLQLSPCKRSL